MRHLNRVTGVVGAGSGNDLCVLLFDRVDHRLNSAIFSSSDNDGDSPSCLQLAVCRFLDRISVGPDATAASWSTSPDDVNGVIIAVARVPNGADGMDVTGAILPTDPLETSMTWT